MTDSEKIETLRQYIASRLAYLVSLIYHHQCNIPEPTMSEQYDYAAACGEHDALCRLQGFLDELIAPHDLSVTQ